MKVKQKIINIYLILSGSALIFTGAFLGWFGAMALFYTPDLPDLMNLYIGMACIALGTFLLLQYEYS